MKIAIFIHSIGHPTILTFCISLFIIYFIYKIFLFFPKNTNLPPGKNGLPFLGETIHFIKALKSENPETFFFERRKYYTNIFRTFLLGENMVVFCGQSANKFIFSPPSNCLITWWPNTIEKIFFQPDINQSFKRKIAKTRQHLHQFLKVDSLKCFIPMMDSMAKDHVNQHWSPYKQVKVEPLSKNFTMELACKLFINVDDPKRVTEDFAKPYEDAIAGMASIPINFPGTTFHLAVKASRVISKKLGLIIAKRKIEIDGGRNLEKSDLMTSMILDGMSEVEIIEKIQGFFVASYETTSSVITFVIKCLAEYPEVYEKVLQEQMEILESKGEGELLNWEDVKKMKYTWCVACEVMRIHPPSLGTFREVTAEFTYGGYTIPKGWKTFWSTFTTHRDPEYFPEPETFDPTRFEGNGPPPFTFVPFGGGPQMCPGKEYARLEVLVFIHNVVTRFKWKKVIPNEKVQYTSGAIAVNGLPIYLEPIDIGN